MRAGSGLCPPPPPHLLTQLPRFASVPSTSVLPYQHFRRITTSPTRHTQTWITWIIFFLQIKRTLQASAVRDTFFPVPELKFTASSGPDPERP